MVFLRTEWKFFKLCGEKKKCIKSSCTDSSVRMFKYTSVSVIDSAPSSRSWYDPKPRLSAKQAYSIPRRAFHWQRYSTAVHSRQQGVESRQGPDDRDIVGIWNMMNLNTRGCQPKIMTSANSSSRKAGDRRSVMSQLSPLPSSPSSS